MKTNLLSEHDYKKSFSDKMLDITNREDIVSPGGVIDVLPYVDAIPTKDMASFTLHERFVECVYRSSDGKHDHVLFMTTTKNVFLVIVVDLKKGIVKGHRILDLNKEYGNTEQGAAVDGPGCHGTCGASTAPSRPAN